MQILDFLIKLFQVPAIIIGLIALIGLVAQKKPLGDTVTGTIKTVLSILIIGGGITVLINALIPIQSMFATALPTDSITTFVTFDEAVVSAVQSENVARLGMLIGLTLLFGYMFHLFLARVTKQRYVYLTGHMIWVHAGGFAILFHSFGLGDVTTVAVASIVDGAYMTFMPALAQPYMRKITGGDDVAFAHGQTLLNVFAGFIGKYVGDPSTSTEDIKVPKQLNFFRDVAVSTTIVMMFVGYAAAIGAVIATDVAQVEQEITGGENWVIFTLLQVLGFTAGMLIMLYGVRMLIAEIVPAFEGIARRLIPSAKPALDVPVIFPFAPNALVIGLISGTIGQLVGMAVLASIGWPMPIPSMIVAFFACGAAAIFANATGGVRGAWIGSFLWGFIAWIAISYAYKFNVFGDLSALGASALGFTVPDLIIPAIIVDALRNLLGGWIAIGITVGFIVLLIGLNWQPRIPQLEAEKAADEAAPKA
ncbi:PTS ascorbate transporter subunit IIC [Cardiobacteriaceae bacterium TAE3-ERU3]|nr:PTS ascorbate transporter subunit IIC [Cardiobacteriaceae bacterium TAE3-ERU3]